ncbi:MAG: diacylglycerol kinase [Sedimentisphaerales bacterium]|nr:diacylglycerol kinase [Sedimentisphaerales bacterium]
MRNKFLKTGQQGFHPIRKIRVALRGVQYAVVFDVAVTYKLVLSLFVLAGCFYYRQWLDFGLVFVSTGLMLLSEMFNTTIEALCDFIESGPDRRIGIIKDIAAAAAGISIFVWFVIVVIELIRVLQVVA